MTSSADLQDQFSATNVKSSQLCEICMALWTSLSWFCSRLLTSAHSSWRSCETLNDKRGLLLLLAAALAGNGLKLAEYRRALVENILKAGAGETSLEWRIKITMKINRKKWNGKWRKTYLDEFEELGWGTSIFFGVSYLLSSGVVGTDLTPPFEDEMAGTLIHLFNFVEDEESTSISICFKRKMKMKPDSSHFFFVISTVFKRLIVKKLHRNLFKSFISQYFHF